MAEETALAQFDEFISHEPARKILTALTDGRYYPVSDLAYLTRLTGGVVRKSLFHLEEAGIVRRENNGRHSYFGIQEKEIASAIQKALEVMPDADLRKMAKSKEKQAVSHARTCYSHIAGNLGVRLADSLFLKGYITNDDSIFYLTESGKQFFHDMNTRLEGKVSGKKCLDWTERRHHIGGKLGKELFQTLLNNSWVERVPDSRNLYITEKGEAELQNRLSIRL